MSKLTFGERFLIMKGRFDWKKVLLFMCIIVIITTLFNRNIHDIIVTVVCITGFIMYAFISHMYPQETAYKEDDIKSTASERKMLKIRRRKNIIGEIIKGS